MSNLTRDGRCYCWCGPGRIEVYDVATGQRIKRVGRDPTLYGEMGGAVSPDGHWLYHDTDSGVRRLDLWGKEPSLDLPPGTGEYSPSAGLWISSQDADFPSQALLFLKPTPDGPPWLALGNDDLSVPNTAHFSDDGHSLVYGSQNGVLTVIDLPALKKEVEEFDRILQSK